MVRYLEEKWTCLNMDHLQDILQLMNKRGNRSHGMAPDSVRKRHGLRFITTAKQKHYSKTTTTTEQRYNVDDKARIASRNMPFRKSYLQQFSLELFTIDTNHSHMQLLSTTL